MSARYTSPDLSRQLAEAGLLVDGGRDPRWWNQNPNLPGWCCDSWQYTPSGQGYKSVRALRLDEVLEELTRDREGGPLCTDYTLNHLSAISLNGEDFARACSSFVGRRPGGSGGSNIQEAGGTDIEAAALVLLALLRERGGK